MDFPESNLQPEAQKWRRAVEKTLTELQRRTGALQTNTKTTGARFSSLVTQTASVERQVGETINDLTEVAEKVERKDQSVWQPKAPVDPEHGQRWFNVKDGNVLRVWIDYGDYARYNFIRNPSFSENTDTWQATGAVLTRTVGPDPMARLDVPADVAEPGDVVLIETEGRSHGEWLEGDPDDPDSGPSGFVGTPWAAGADVQVVSGNEDVRAILDVITDTDVVVSTSGPVEVSAASITRVLATPVEGEYNMEEVRLRLTVTNLSGGDVVFVDKVMLEAATDTGGDYFDGDMPGVEWIDDPEAGRISQWLGYPDWYELRDEKILHEMEEAREWIDETGQELVQRLGSAEGAISTVEDVLENVRSNVGRKQWVWAPGAGPQVLVVHDPEPTATEFVRAEPLGDGKVKFTALIPGVHTDWQVGAATGLADGDTYTHTFTETGTFWVRVRTDGVLHQAPFTVEPAVLGPADELGSWEDMEWPDIDWSDAEIGLDQLRDAGLLDPDVWSRLFEDVVVGGVVAATEAFIGSNAIIDNAVQARHVVASESLWAKLATFARVTTDMLLVGGSNLLPDPRFEDAELTAGRMSRSAATAVSGGYQTTQYFYFCPGTAAADVRRYAVPVTAGDTYRIEIPVTLTSALSSTPRLETWNTSATGRTLRTVTDWSYENGILSYTYTVPEGVAYLSPIIYRTTSYTVHPGARVTLMADSRLLVDGAVTARALNVVHELPSGDVLRIDPDGIRVWRAGNNGPYPNIALTAGDGFCIQTDTGEGLLWIDPATGDLHTAGAVTTGGTITGSTFRTGTTGRRQQIDTANGFRAWNSANQQTAQIDGADNWLAGTFRTSRPGQPGMIAGTSTEGYPIMLWSESGEGYWSDAYITAGFTWDDEQQWDLLFSARSGSYLRFDGGLTGMPEGTFYSLGPWSISKTGQGMFRSLSTTGLNASDGAIDTNSIGLNANINNRLIFEGDGVLRAPGIRANSNTNAANVFINASGRLHFGTSARRFKNDIQDIPEDWPERILDLNPKTWIDAGEAAEHEEGDPPLRRVPGLVAEDVEDVGLSAYVTYADGQVQGLSYDRLWTLFIPVVRKQRDRITDLEQKVTTLEQQVADLTARLDPKGA